MRALLIDAHTITEHEIDGSLQAMYALIDCRLVTGAGYPDQYHAAWVDDEGLLTLRRGTPCHRVTWYPEPLAGNLLITGFDPATGETCDAIMTLDDLRDRVITGMFV